VFLTNRDLRANGICLNVVGWGSPEAPPLVAVPGTGLPAGLFAEFARLTGNVWHGFALDRRAHGLSDAPDAGYDFTDFSDDLVGVIDALGIRGGLGVGHSAGGTDMLLAAAARPDAFARMIIIEPTIQDPRRAPGPPFSDEAWEARGQAQSRRRTTYPSYQAAFERWSTRDPFSRIRPDLLREYIGTAFAEQPDGSVELRCHREHESQMLRPIASAMEHCYHPPSGQPDPFAALASIEIPVTLVTMGQSGDRYAPMAEIAASLLPNVERRHYPEIGHLLPLEAPAVLAEIVGTQHCR
jgi:pimeloyl-ACP methyl ester carboxylesterase